MIAASDRWRSDLKKGLEEEAVSLHGYASVLRERAEVGFADAKEALAANLPLDQLFPGRRDRPIWEEHRPWHARYRIPLLAGVAIILFAFVVLANRSGTDAGTAEVRFPDRLGREGGDIEAIVSQKVTINGMSVSVTGVELLDELELTTLRRSSDDPLEEEPAVKVADAGKEWVVVDLIIQNVSGRTRRIGSSPFRLQTATGALVRSSPLAVDQRLGTTEVVDEGYAQGRLVFQVPADDADRYLIYRPQLRGKRLIVQLEG